MPTNAVTRRVVMMDDESKDGWDWKLGYEDYFLARVAAALARLDHQRVRLAAQATRQLAERTRADLDRVLAARGSRDANRST